MDPESTVLGARRDLEHARSCYERGVWSEAYRSLSSVDRSAPLGGADLERLAMSAYLAGHESDDVATLDRAHRLYVDRGERPSAVRCAFWLWLLLFVRGDRGAAWGWFARGQRLIACEKRDCVERGYLLLPLVLRRISARDWPGADAIATRAAAIGEQFHEPDLTACARHLQGRIRIEQRRLPEALALLDEVMIAVTGGELSPLITGLIYRSVIESCRHVYEFDRVREWTAGLARWRGHWRAMAFVDVCKVYRLEVMNLYGAWSSVIDEAREFVQCPEPAADGAVAQALYQQAEAHRLRGEFLAAEAAYRGASQSGLDPQPGLALLRASQGQLASASAAIRCALLPVTDWLERSRYLPAYVEIMLAEEKLVEAQEGARELEEIAQGFGTAALKAIAASARGAVELAAGDARSALESLQLAWRIWKKLGARYLGARVRVLVARTCQALGDQDGCDLELAAARAVFNELGATPDLAGLNSGATGGSRIARLQVLSPREMQVLRLVAQGRTNKSIAEELIRSEKTIDRHVSNIFTKLGVHTRTAATAFAYEHRLWKVT